MKKLLVLIVPVVLAGFAAVGGSLGIAPEGSLASLTPSNDVVVSGTMLGSNDCIIYFTLDSAHVDEVIDIDCPPEGFPPEAAGKGTLREKAIALLPSYEQDIASMKEVR